MDNKERFSNRVDDYVAHRPSYPPEVVEFLIKELGIPEDGVIADVGSGTGISTQLVLDNSKLKVFAVEPNLNMRQAAEKILGTNERFVSVNGDASHTTLPDASVDAVLAAQAFHWFNVQESREEFRRILRKKDGLVILLYNIRKLDVDDFHRDYEAILNSFGTDYARVKHQTKDVEGFYGTSDYKTKVLTNCQVLSYEALCGRVASTSYLPSKGHPDYERMLEHLRVIFDKHKSSNNTVTLEYDVAIIYSPIL